MANETQTPGAAGTPDPTDASSANEPPPVPTTPPALGWPPASDSPPPPSPDAPALGGFAKPDAPGDAGAGVSAERILGHGGRWLLGELGRPRVRTAVVGVLLIVLGAAIINNSAWTFPVVLVGIIMIVVAWVGGRLEGRFGIEWGEAGAGFELRARFRSAGVSTPPHTRPLPAGPSTTTTTAVAAAPAVTATTTAGAETPLAPEADVVIDGEAHTIEIDVNELKALIAAAERSPSETATVNGTRVSWQEAPTSREHFGG